MAFQSDYRYTFESAGGEAFDVIGFELAEELSTPFKLQISLTRSNYDPVDFGDLLDRPGTLTIWQESDPIRFVNGIITHFHQGGSGFRRTDYQAVLEPAYARTALNSNCRIFQQRTLPEIIKILLKENGIIQHKFSLHFSHEKRDYTVQYRETDKAFIERLAAEEGIHYFFVHEAASHTLVLSDTSWAGPGLGEILYHPNRSATPTESSLWGLDYREKIATAAHRMRDYTFKNPAYSLEHRHTQPLAHQRKSYQKYDYPGRYKRDAQGKPFNQHRLEQERRDTELAYAQSDHLQLLPGHQIKLSQPPDNTAHEYWQIVGIRHTGVQPQSQHEEAGSGGSHYFNELKLIPTDHPWRPATEHKPRVDGPQMAHVVGPKGEEIYTDEYGRVKVQFPWDREGERNEFSSCWIRVAQGWAGAAWGAMAVPRIGQEVIVDFLEGDPDQPIITGRTYHAVNPPPYDLPANKTRMTIKSKTHKGEGYNELRFEDEKDKEEIFIHAQKDQNNVVLNDETTEIGASRAESVGKDEIIKIGNQRKLEVFADQTITTGGHHSHKVGGKAELKAGEQIRQLTKVHEVSANESLVMKAPGGAIVIDSSGITLKGKVMIKGSLAIQGGGWASQVESLKLNFNKGKSICVPCMLQGMGL